MTFGSFRSEEKAMKKLNFPDEIEKTINSHTSKEV
jgi:hypothetical protein